jgi:hypothetical protein
MQETTTISRKEQIIKTSERLFKEKGCGTSMQILPANDMSGSLYSHINQG